MERFFFANAQLVYKPACGQDESAYDANQPVGKPYSDQGMVQPAAQPLPVGCTDAPAWGNDNLVKTGFRGQQS